MLSFPNHIGTHVDVPYHFFENGMQLTDYKPDFWIFNNPQCVEVSCGDGHLICIEDLKGEIKANTDLLLLRTGYEKYRNGERYWNKNPGLSPEIAKKLRELYPNIRALGTDLISVTSFLHRKIGRETHREFLGNQYKTDPIVLIEDMSLVGFNNYSSKVIVLPLLIVDADGAPCTIVSW